MSIKQDLQIKLFNDNNESISGVLTIEGFPSHEVNISSASDGKTEADPKGAGTYVITVVLLYGLAIVFMIASHVFVKKKEERLENQIRLVDKYWEQAPGLRERGARESYRKLKHSIVPVVAKSGARDLISRRKSFAPILASAGIFIDNEDVGRKLSIHSDCGSTHSGDEDNLSEKSSTKGSKPFLTVPSFLELPRKVSNATSPTMPSISEEEAVDSVCAEKKEMPKIFLEDETNVKSINQYISVPYRQSREDYRIPTHTSKHLQNCTTIKDTNNHINGLRPVDRLCGETFIEGDVTCSLLGQSETCISIESLNSTDEEVFSASAQYDSNSDSLAISAYQQYKADMYKMTWVSDGSIRTDKSDLTVHPAACKIDSLSCDTNDVIVSSAQTAVAPSITTQESTDQNQPHTDVLITML